MGHGYLTAATVVCLSLAGCSVTSRFQVFDATTNQPLEGVRVTRYEWHEWTATEKMASAAPRPNTEVPLGPTGSDGTLASTVPSKGIPAENHFGFMFVKLGYKPAEARVEGGNADVASPSAGSRWLWKGAGVYVPPAAYERTVPSSPLIRIPMWPTQSPTSPTSAPAKFTQ